MAARYPQDFPIYQGIGHNGARLCEDPAESLPGDIHHP
jgi:hypothetical protein